MIGEWIGHGRVTEEVRVPLYANFLGCSTMANPFANYPLSTRVFYDQRLLHRVVFSWTPAQLALLPFNRSWSAWQASRNTWLICNARRWWQHLSICAYLEQDAQPVGN